MRVAHIITRMIVGGAQENTLLTCQLLAQIHGDEVLLITGPSLGPEGELMPQGGAGGVSCKIIPAMRREIHPWRDGTSYRLIKRELRRFQPQVVHTHSAKGGILGRLAATALNIPAIVHTVHGAPFHPYQHRLANWFGRRAEKFAAGKCHQLVSVSNAMTEQMVAAGIAGPGKFTTVYSGMDIAPLLRANQHRDLTRRDLGFDQEHVVIGKIARLFPLKGHAYVIDAASRVIERHGNARFLIVGDGTLRQDLQSSLRRAGLLDYFRFTGLVAPQRIPHLIGAMDLLVHASLREGLARALPQALIAGKPVVSFDIDGAREVVISNETGFLVCPRDVVGLADSLCHLIDDGELRRRFGATGQKRFADQFRAETMVQRLRDIYVSLLQNSSGSCDTP